MSKYDFEIDFENAELKSENERLEEDNKRLREKIHLFEDRLNDYIALVNIKDEALISKEEQIRAYENRKAIRFFSKIFVIPYRAKRKLKGLLSKR